MQYTQPKSDRTHLPVTEIKGRGARPIRCSEISLWFDKYVHQDINLEEYTSTWRNWIQKSDHKIITGLDNFLYGDFSLGTSQTFDHFLLKHSTREIVVFPGEFQYHKCAGRNLKFGNRITEKSALIISTPFSDLGKTHPNLFNILEECNQLRVPVCLDLAYWGISKNIELHLEDFPCITEITCSLSKPFFTLERHRVGIRFSRNYTNDGISMINEVNMSNVYSMGLGVHYMKMFSCDYMWNTYNDMYYKTCDQLKLNPTDTVIFGTSNDDYQWCNRGISGNNRVCISEELSDQ